jgi:hypothetical protein
MRAAMLCCLLVVACRPGVEKQSSGSSSSPNEAERVVQRFAKEPKVHVTVSPRIVYKSFVIDHETATGLATGGTRTADWIYQVEGGRIIRAWLLPE